MATAEIAPTTDLVCIYVIGSDGGSIKVGLSIKPKARLKQLQSNSPDRLVIYHMEWVPKPDGMTVEKYAHSLLWSRRVRGEWFDITSDQAITAVKLGAAGVAAGRLPPGPVFRVKEVGPESVRGESHRLSREQSIAKKWYRRCFRLASTSGGPGRHHMEAVQARSSLREAHAVIRESAGETGVTMMRLVAGQGMYLSEIPGSYRQRHLLRAAYEKALDSLTVAANA